MSRAYEALVILKATGTEAELAHVVKQLEDPIKKLGGAVESSVNWGRRRLAYRVGRQSEGYYQLVQFQVLPSQVNELKRLFRLNESIVRFLILNRATPQAASSPAAGGTGQNASQEAEPVAPETGAAASSRLAHPGDR